jgi:hypothetical protein
LIQNINLIRHRAKTQLRRGRRNTKQFSSQQSEIPSG